MLMDIDKTEAKVDKEMVSFLTHTLSNSLCTVPSTLREIIERLSASYEQKTEVINEVASLLTTFSIVGTLIKTFKLYVAEQRIFDLSWHQDNQGEGNIELVLAFVLRETVGRMLFNRPKKFKKLVSNGTTVNIKALQQSFMNEVMVLELNHKNAEKIFQWLSQNLNLFSFDLEKTDTIHFKRNGIRFTFMFAILSELIYNALKYSNSNRIELTWRMVQDHYNFTIRNTFDFERRHEGDSTRKGLVFVKKLMDRLGKSELEIVETNNLFTVKLLFHKTHFEENTCEYC
jgi:hypothetical protein